ncbi:MAG: exosome complex RNA-binding protein Csl4 [Candidatus Micrarchaeia archaeon]
MEDDICYPGDDLGSEIEYGAGSATYVENEVVRSKVFGKKLVDNKQRIIDVKPVFAMPEEPKVGMEFYGFVEEVTDTAAAITLDYDRSTGRRNLPDTYAMMRIEDAKSPGIFVKSMKEIVRAGDIVKVKVSKIKGTAIDVSIKGADLGVIKAFCTKCRIPLKLKDNKLVCLKCGRTEKRSLGKPYLEVIK